MTRTLAVAAAATLLLAGCTATTPEDIAADKCRDLAAHQLGGGRGIATDITATGDDTFLVLGENNNAAMFRCTVRVPSPDDPDTFEAHLSTD